PTDDRWKQKYKEPEPLDTNELPSLPEGWTWAPLAALGGLKGGITKGFKPRAGEVHREVPYLRVANVQRGYLDLTDVRTISTALSRVSAKVAAAWPPPDRGGCHAEHHDGSSVGRGVRPLARAVPGAAGA